MSKYGVFSGPNTGKYGPDLYLDTFHAMIVRGFHQQNFQQIFTDQQNLIVDIGVRPFLHSNCYHHYKLNLKIKYPPL